MSGVIVLEYLNTWLISVDSWHKSVVVSHQGLRLQSLLFPQHNRRLQIKLAKTKLKNMSSQIWNVSWQPRKRDAFTYKRALELKSRLSGSQKYVGTQVQLLRQNISTFVVVTPVEVFDELSKSLQRSLQVESWARKSDKQSDSSCFHILYTFFPVQVEKRWVVSNFDCIIYSRIWQLKSAICNSTKVVSASEWMQSVMGSDELSNIISNFYDDLRQIPFTFKMWIHGTVSFNNNLRRLIVFIDQTCCNAFSEFESWRSRARTTHSGIEGWGASIPKVSPTLFSQLLLADGNWSDSEGCIARRSWLHYRTEEYWDMLQTSPFEFLFFSGFPQRQFLRTTWWHLLYRHRTHLCLWNKIF